MTTQVVAPSDWQSRPVLTVRQYAALMGCAVQTAYNDVNAGRVPTIMVGRRRRIPTIAVRRMLGEVVEAPTGDAA